MKLKDRWAIVVWSGGCTRRFRTVRQAEKWIAQREKSDPKGVHGGQYSIDASPKAEADYQRLVNRRKK